MTKRDLSEVSTAELKAELNRRATGDKKSLNELEVGYLEGRNADAVEGFEQWLKEASERETDEGKPCPRCGKAVSVNAKKRQRTLYTAAGKVSYVRNYHYCHACKHGFYPLDQEVGAPDEGQATRELARRAVDFGVNESYEPGCKRFELHYGFSVSTCLMQSLVERIPMPEYSVEEPMLPTETITVGADGSMLPMRKGWQECKLATVVREQHHSAGTTEKRGSISEAIYVATMGDVHAFEAHLRQILPVRIPMKERQDTPQADIVWIADGAAWIWKMQQRLCPTANAILDWMHAIQNAMDCGKIVLDGDETLCALWKRSIEQRLWEGNVQIILDELQEALLFARKRAHKKALKKLIGYYTENSSRMNYKLYRQKGYMIGSGITESAHKHVLQTRMKKSGQHWSEKGAEKMVRLRALYRTYGPHRFFDVVFPENNNHLDFIDKLAA